MDIVIRPFKEAFEKRGNPKNLMFHSDQGTQYTAFEFRMILYRNRVARSFSHGGYPLDNAVAEAFFSKMKAESLHKEKFMTIGDLRAAVTEYIEFFNGQRPHESLGYLTPDLVETQ